MIDEAVLPVSLDKTHRLYAQRGQHAFIQRNWQLAIDSFREALRLSPDNADYLCGLGTCLKAVDYFGEAEALLRQAIRLAPAPSAFTARQNLANLLVARRKFEEAQIIYKEMIAAEPRNIGAYQNLGNLFLELGRNAEALSLARSFVSASPNDIRAYDQLTVALDRLGDLESALASSHQALRLRSGNRLDMTLTSYLSLAGRNGYLSARRYGLRLLNSALLEDLPKLSSSISAQVDVNALRRLAFLLPYYAVPERDHLAVLKTLGDHLSKPAIAPAYRARKSTGPLRVGYLSYNFGDHPIGHLLSPFFESHDPAKIQLYLYSLNRRPHDQSGYPERIKATTQNYRDLSNKSDDVAADTIRSDALDLLIDLDGYLGGGRPEVLARRPAPVQIHWLQHLAGMPAPFIDYTIVDQVLVDDHADFSHHGPLIRLSGAFQCGDQVDLSAPAPSRTDVGLPEEGFVFCAFGNWLKIDEDVFQCWIKILQAVDSSHLWLSKGPGDHAIAKLREVAQQQGIDPARLHFANRMPSKTAHLNRHRCADLFLDTFTFSAATTTVDALWAGLPVLTRRGTTAYSRLSESLLCAAGLSELVARNSQEYVDRAIRLAKNPVELAALRDHVWQQRNLGALFDAQSMAMEFEALYQRVHDHFISGQPPLSFDIVKNLDESSDVNIERAEKRRTSLCAPSGSIAASPPPRYSVSPRHNDEQQVERNVLQTV